MITFPKLKSFNRPIVVKLLKFSIFLTFVLSLLGAGLTFYLSNVRENEKEKRLYLEGVRTKLEGDIQNLQAEVQKLESENQELQQRLLEEQAARDQVLALVQDRDSEVKRLEQEVRNARQSFEEAQKRNQELEKILDDLEARMQEMEAQRTLQPPDVGVVGWQVVPPSEPPAVSESSPVETVPPDVSPAPEPAPAPETQIKETPVEENVSPAPVIITPVTEAPKPPRKRKFFGWFRSSKSDEKKSETSEEKTKTVEAVSGPAVSESDSALTEKKEKPAEIPVETEESKLAAEPEKVESKPEAAKVGQQTIAAGSVLLINRVHNFAVINLGSRHGLAINDILHIQRGESEIAKVRVEKLYEDYCAAYIVEEQSGKPIQEGDVAGVV